MFFSSFLRNLPKVCFYFSDIKKQLKTNKNNKICLCIFFVIFLKENKKATQICFNFLSLLFLGCIFVWKNYLFLNFFLKKILFKVKVINIYLSERKVISSQRELFHSRKREKQAKHERKSFPITVREREKEENVPP